MPCWLRPAGRLHQAVHAHGMHGLSPRQTALQVADAIKAAVSNPNTIAPGPQDVHFPCFCAAPFPSPGAAVGIPSEFQQVHSSLCLHIWMLLVRLRPEGKDGKQLAQVGGGVRAWEAGAGAGRQRKHHPGHVRGWDALAGPGPLPGIKHELLVLKPGLPQPIQQ